MFRVVEGKGFVDEERGLRFAGESEEFMRFEARGRVLMIPWEIGAPRDILYVAPPMRWQPPHDGEDISPTELAEIREHLLEAGALMGGVELVPASMPTD